MACIVETPTGQSKYIQLSPGEVPTGCGLSKRPKISLGKVTRKQAQVALGHIENLIRAKTTGSVMPQATADYLANATEAVLARLEKVKLIEPRQKKVVKLGPFIATYIDSRDDYAENTRRNHEQTMKDLLECFPADMLLADFTRANADEFRRSLLKKGQKETSVRRTCKRAKQYFTEAIKHRIITENPFDTVATADVTDPERQAYISPEMIDKVLDACPDIQWRLIFGFARYGGLRIPSELEGLQWDHILWDQNRFIVHSPKTKRIPGKATREMALLPKLAALLLEAFEAISPEDKELHIFPSLGDRSNIRTQARKIIKRAGFEPWEKLFVNLRSSLETDLMEEFPEYIVCKWIGNSPKVARKHYLQVTDEHFARAANRESNWRQNREQISEHREQNREQNPAATARNVLQDQNQDVRFTPANTTHCENIQKGAAHEGPHHTPLRRVELRSPG